MITELPTEVTAQLLLDPVCRLDPVVAVTAGPGSLKLYIALAICSSTTFCGGMLVTPDTSSKTNSSQRFHISGVH